VASVLRRRILHAELLPGVKLNEQRLATELGVSRTPLREALHQLAQEGFLTAEPGRGFSVAPLSSREVGELFAIIGALEAQAIEWAGFPDVQAMAELQEINARLATALGDVEQALALNDRWHRTLVRRCPNGHLIRMIGELRSRIYRYEYYYFVGGADHVQTSVRLHRDIQQGLAARSLSATRDAIARHWLTDLDLMLPRILAEAQEKGAEVEEWRTTTSPTDGGP
jgi:DNA-binding GntR family transcriptional regulator